MDLVTLALVKKLINQYYENPVTKEQVTTAVRDYMEENPVQYPPKLPNPQSLFFTGAVEATYDGSEEVMVEIPNSVQPDWNQNDSTAKDYVKNRPFYSEESYMLVHEENVTFTKDSYSNLYYGYIYASPHICDGSYANGTTCKIVIDGEEYSGIVNSFSSLIYIGNGSWVEGRVPDTGEPFCIFLRDSTNFGIFSSKPLTTCKVSIFVEEAIIHKLDPKYLPDEHINSLIDTKLGVIENGTY